MPHRSPRGFTLVEMLVVIGIIAVLAALLLPAVMMAINAARNAAIALEIKQIDTAIEAYRLEKGDYPPNFRNPDVVRRHIAKCYPRINGVYLDAFMTRVFPPNGLTVPTPPSSTVPGTVVIDESESLVFWLSMTDSNAQFPFLSYLPWPQTGSPMPVNPKRYYDFEETRLVTTSPAITVLPAVQPLRSFTAKFCQDSCYIYMDSRSYDRPLTEGWDLGRFVTDPAVSTFTGDTFAFSKATRSAVRPYWSETKNPNAPSTGSVWRNLYKPVNATTFQLICAGQDGDFGFDSSLDSDIKVFNSGLNYTVGDKDNITNFSGGQTLGNAIP